MSKYTVAKLQALSVGLDVLMVCERAGLVTNTADDDSHREESRAFARMAPMRSLTADTLGSHIPDYAELRPASQRSADHG